MYRVYEIFEVMPNGSPQKVTIVSGLEFAKVALERLTKHTNDECYAADAKTRQVVMQMNMSAAKLRVTKRIFQIAYDEELGFRRAELLRSHGYAVISVTGNQAARILLSRIQQYDLFIVGQAAPEEIRKEIVDWLKAQYPLVKIIALNPPNQRVLSADYNVMQNGPENWLPIGTQLLVVSAIPGPSNTSSTGA
jgi:hypothetical protein